MKREDEERFSLARWSRRKIESGRAGDVAASQAARAANALPGTASGTPPAAPAPAPVDLPPVDSLTFDSDFTAFLRPEVDEGLKRAALKQLFRDPRFNVMDGLDVYIDDYTKADPIPADTLAELVKRFDFAGAPPAAPASSEGEESAPEESLSSAGEDRRSQASDDSLPAPREQEGEADMTAADPSIPRATTERR